MIYTVTLNPSIDYIVRLNEINYFSVNRMDSDDKYIGGKGINVSRVLKTLGKNSIAIGFVGGFTGDFIESGLNKFGIKTDFVKVDGDTRINIKIKSSKETEINAKGPYISEKNINELEGKINKITNNDIVVFSGSAPFNLGNSIYERIIPLAKNIGAEIVCDFEGDNLLNSLDKEPLLVKPNIYELEKMFDTRIENIEDIKLYGKKLLEMGAKNVIISMGKDGAIFMNNRMALISENVKGTAKNSVGAGDSMVAGFIYGYDSGYSTVDSFKLGIACGSATAFSDDLATVEKIKKIYNITEVVGL